MCRIKFSVKEPSHVTIKIVNILGVEVCTLLDENQPAGQHEIECDQTKFGPGSYYYKIYIDEPVMNGTHKRNNEKILIETQPLEISQNSNGHGGDAGRAI